MRRYILLLGMLAAMSAYSSPYYYESYKGQPPSEEVRKRYQKSITLRLNQDVVDINNKKVKAQLEIAENIPEKITRPLSLDELNALMTEIAVLRQELHYFLMWVDTNTTEKVAKMYDYYPDKFRYVYNRTKDFVFFLSDLKKIQPEEATVLLNMINEYFSRYHENLLVKNGSLGRWRHRLDKEQYLKTRPYATKQELETVKDKAFERYDKAHVSIIKLRDMLKDELKQ